MNYVIGGIEIRIASEGSSFLGSRLSCFVSEQGGYPSTLNLKVYERDEPSYPGPYEANLVSVHSEGDRVIIERRDFKGYFDLNSFEGEVEVSSEISFDSFLRIIYSLILPNDHGLVIHASSLVRDGKSYVFPGKSGVGKSTIAGLSPDATLLTDEISIIREIGKSTIAYGTPFHGNLGIPGENTCAPVLGLYFPVQDTENFLEELSSKSALERLLPNIVSFGQDHDLIRKIFHLAYELVTSLPCYDLHFLPEPSFWNCIHAKESTLHD